MISFEEFKAEYKEKIDIQIAVAGAQPTDIFELSVEQEGKADSPENVEKIVLDADNSHSTDFPKTFGLFESNMQLLIDLKTPDGKEIATKFKVGLQDILVEEGLTLGKDLKIDGLYLYARILIPEETYPMYSIGIDAKDLPQLVGLFGECDPFVRILRKNPNFDNYAMVYESEVCRQNPNPCFRPFKCSLQKLCGGDNFREIKIQVWDFSKRGGHFIVGEFRTNLNNLQLLNKNKTAIKLMSIDGNKQHGTATIRELTSVSGPSFIKKLTSGLKINMLSGIDTTLV